ncbi:LysR family transcriptional regulator [Streptomyces sp. NPDC047108]|uniref:LysR family transcriptional regulator n=1 Tax=Streptomyces sp. NPDC047108 TaxID=3155025 RepID=UPI0033DE1C92
MRLLRAFLVVAHELSFTRAARRLFLTQQAVSAQVRALEAGLQVQLFDRTTRRVHLTPAGRLLRDRIDPALQALDSALACVREAGAAGQWSMRIGHTADAGHRLLPESAGIWERREPGLHLRSVECTEQSLRPALLGGRVDLGVGIELGPPGPGLAGRTLGRERLCAVVGRRHPLAGAGAVTLSGLSGYDWLCWPRASHPGHWNTLHGLARFLEREPALHEAWLSLSHLRLLQEDLVMPQPASYADRLPRGLVALTITSPVTVAYSALWNPRSAPPLLDLLVDVLAESAVRLGSRAGPPLGSAPEEGGP